jgi:hypothetical protein
VEAPATNSELLVRGSPLYCSGTALAFFASVFYKSQPALYTAKIDDSLNAENAALSVRQRSIFLARICTQDIKK